MTLEMRSLFIILEYLLIYAIQPMRQTVISNYCTVDAAISYTGNNKMYLFKDRKYARWSDGKNTVKHVRGKFAQETLCSQSQPE